jgi:hypothetical protein
LLWCEKKYSETYEVGEVEIDFVSDLGLEKNMYQILVRRCSLVTMWELLAQLALPTALTPSVVLTRNVFRHR